MRFVPKQNEMDQDQFERLVRLAAKATEIPVALVFSGSRKPRHVSARRVLAWALIREGWSAAAVGRIMGYDHTSVLHWKKTTKAEEQTLAKQVIKDSKKLPERTGECGELDWDHATGEGGMGCVRPVGHAGRHSVPVQWHEWSPPMP